MIREKFEGRSEVRRTSDRGVTVARATVSAQDDTCDEVACGGGGVSVPQRARQHSASSPFRIDTKEAGNGPALNRPAPAPSS